MPLGSTAAHDPTGSEILRAEVEVPRWTMNKMSGMNIQGQTASIRSLVLQEHYAY
ncbi:MAG TPA: hypothetical protein VNL13_00680 [Sulfolobales archaeon]|nr:hypothetical protein [Sulfolobales archaeon]